LEEEKTPALAVDNREKMWAKLYAAVKRWTLYRTQAKQQDESFQKL